MLDCIPILRNATDNDVDRALEGASFGAWPLDNSALLEFFHRMLDQLAGEHDD